MRFTQANIERLPGLTRRVSIEHIGAGLNLIYGPNASGKSTLGRSLIGALFDHSAVSQLILNARVEAQDERIWSLTLSNGQAHWQGASAWPSR